MVGLVVVAFGLAVAVVKPWESATPPSIVQPPLAAAAPSSASGPTSRFSAGAALAPVAGPAHRVPVPRWADVRLVIEQHDGWGVRAIIATRSPTRAPDGSPCYEERWSATRPSRAGVDSAYLDPDDRSIVGLGITFPPGRSPIDARISRVQADLDESIDARALDGRDPDGAFLFLRYAVAEGGFQTWAAGQYRIDVLTKEGIHRIILRIPARFEPIRLPAD